MPKKPTKAMAKAIHMRAKRRTSKRAMPIRPTASGLTLGLSLSLSESEGAP